MDFKARVIRLEAQDTKTQSARTIYLTTRVVRALRDQPRAIRSDYVFVNRRTGTHYQHVNDAFRRAVNAAKLDGLWFHDLRRSFVTNARRQGIPESVIMRMTGHKTRAVFDRYNIVNEDDMRSAVQTLDAARAGLGQDTGKVS